MSCSSVRAIERAASWRRAGRGNSRLLAFKSGSAGTHPHPDGVHPIAVEVMKEKGVDISRHYSKSLSDIPQNADYVITLCSEADAECPTHAARVARLAWHLPDPGIAGADEQALRSLFRQIRDEIERRLREFFSGPSFRNPGQV